jgi:hypothetical protein
MIMQQESLESIKEYWTCLRALLTEKYITDKVKSRALDLLKSVSEPSSLRFQPDAVSEDKTIDDYEFTGNCDADDVNPFISFFAFHDECSEDNSRDKELNRYYSLKVCHRLEQIIIKLCPLTTAIMLNGRFTRHTNASVENYFKIMKRQVYKVGLSPMDPGEFVDTSYINAIPMVSNRIAFLNNYPPTSKITSSRKRMDIDMEQQKEEEKEKQFPKMDTVKEVWKKKSNKKI